MTVIRRMKVLGYAKVKILLRDGAYTDFTQLADDIGRTVLSADLGMSINTLRKRTNDSGLWSIRELAALSDLLEIEHKILLEMADRLRKKKSKK